MYDKIKQISKIIPFPVIKRLTEQQKWYDELQTMLFKLSPYTAKRIIKIIEEETNDIDRRIALIESTIQEISAGADYSKVETIDDMAEVYARSLLRRLEF